MHTIWWSWSQYCKTAKPSTSQFQINDDELNINR